MKYFNLVNSIIWRLFLSLNKKNMKKDIFNMYASRVAEKFHLTLDEMFVKNKTRDIVDSRQILFYLCVQRPIRISYIQKFLKDNGLELSHSTIIHGYKHAQKMIKEDEDWATMVDQIENEVKNHTQPV